MSIPFSSQYRIIDKFITFGSVEEPNRQVIFFLVCFGFIKLILHQIKKQNKKKYK